MTNGPSVPDQIGSDPINVLERRIRQVDCPNPDCNGVLDITNINVGTKIKCKSCSNVTWLPDYGKKWWQRPVSIISGLLLSFIIGVASSLTASWVGAANSPSQDSVEKPLQNVNSPKS